MGEGAQGFSKLRGGPGPRKPASETTVVAITTVDDIDPRVPLKGSIRVPLSGPYKGSRI